MASTKMLPNLSMSKKGDGEGGGDGQNRPERISDHALTKNDLWKLQFLATGEAKVASTLLNKLTDEDPERSLSRSGMIIDTDPRHMTGSTILDAPLPGLGGTSKGKTEAGGKSASLSYVNPEQMALEEQAIQDRILYEMRQNLAKLKDYGKQLGIAFDVSKKKSRGGRMQGEKWEDEEMMMWKKQATRLLKQPEDMKQTPEEEHREAKMEYAVFQMERMLNDVKCMRIQKTKQRNEMENELNVTAEQEARELAGDGKMASMMSAVAILREKIQDTDQRLGEEEVSKRELSKVHDELFSEYKVNQNKLDDIHKKLADFGHDSNQLRLQLKDRLHEIEKVLGQGKLLTMAEIKEEMAAKYAKELESRQKLIQKQIKIKEMLKQHEMRAKELTKKLQSQYDPNKDSPRRNELKRKAQAFEEVFDTMMKRIGESDITKIVDLFQKQSFTCSAWMEAVRDQEVRVKALLDEKALLDTQLQRVSAKKPQGSNNETRQYTITGRKLDMATERVDTCTERVMQLDGVIAHAKESVRMAFVRLKDYVPDAEVPPLVIPDAGDGGLIEWLDRYANQVASLIPTTEQYQILAETDSVIELSPEFRIDMDNPYGLNRPNSARNVDSRVGERKHKPVSEEPLAEGGDAVSSGPAEAAGDADADAATKVPSAGAVADGPQAPAAPAAAASAAAAAAAEGKTASDAGAAKVPASDAEAVKPAPDSDAAPAEGKTASDAGSAKPAPEAEAAPAAPAAPAASDAPPSPEKSVAFEGVSVHEGGGGDVGKPGGQAKPAQSGIYVSMPAKLKVAIRMAPDDVGFDPKDEDEEATGLNVRIAFPKERNVQKGLVDKEREEDEQEARAEHLDETIVSRDEHKRRAMRLIKQKEREKAEKEALEMGEVSVSKKKKKGRSKA